MFPTIQNINQVIQQVNCKEEFKLNPKPDLGFVSIDYVYVVPSIHKKENFTFDNCIARELRGIKFCIETGNILARPFHKFFNVGERTDLEDLYKKDLDYVMFKEDGSLVHFMIIKDRLRIVTKAGINEISLRAEIENQELINNKNFQTQIRALINSGKTTCFEYTSPNNLVVVRYKKPNLTLLGIRDNITGLYFSQDELIETAEKLKVSLPIMYKDISLEEVRDWVNKEGVILVYKSGYRLKYKCLDYVTKHRAIDELRNKANIVKKCLENKLDDYYSFVSLDVADMLKQFHGDLVHTLFDLRIRYLNFLDSQLENLKNNDRKSFAIVLNTNKDFNTFDKGFLFSIVNLEEIQKVIHSKELKMNDVRMNKVRMNNAGINDTWLNNAGINNETNEECESSKNKKLLKDNEEVNTRIFCEIKKHILSYTDSNKAFRKIENILPEWNY